MIKQLIIKATNRLLKDAWFQIVERDWSYAIFIKEQIWCKKIYVEERNVVKQLFLVWVKEDEDKPNVEWFDVAKFMNHSLLTDNQPTDANTNQGEVK